MYALRVVSSMAKVQWVKVYVLHYPQYERRVFQVKMCMAWVCDARVCVCAPVCVYDRNMLCRVEGINPATSVNTMPCLQVGVLGVVLVSSKLSHSLSLVNNGSVW